MTTIGKLASQLGLSTATVSRALSGHPYVADGTRARVVRAAEKAGYQPNGLARALRREETKLVGLVVPDMRSEFFSSVTAVMQPALEDHGYRLILAVSHDDAAIDRSLIGAMMQHRVDGIVHVPCTARGAGVFASDATLPPVVELNRRSRGSHADSVTADDRSGARQAVDHLHELGHTRIGMIGGRSGASTTRERVGGFEEGLGAAGLASTDALILRQEYSVDWGRKAMRRLARLDDPPTAVFASSTQLAAGALQVLVELGWRVPRDISVVAFDDPPWYTASQPSITSYVDPLESMGMMAAELLISRMTSDADRKRRTHCSLSGEFVVRKSTGRPRDSTRKLRQP